MIPVAILSTPEFNAPLMADRTSLTFGRTGEESSLYSCSEGGKDVNGDGLLDLVCHFKTQMTGFEIEDTKGFLKGTTLDGSSVQDSDVLRIVK